MAMTFQSAINHAAGTTGSTTSTVSGLTWDAAWEAVLMHVAGTGSAANTSAIALTAASVSDGTNTLTLTIPSGGTNYQTYSLPTSVSYHSSVAYAKCADATPGALSTSAGACTLTMTWSRAVGAHGAGFVGLNMGTSASSPFRALEYKTSADANTASITHASMAVEQDGVAVICEWNSGSAASFAQSTSFTEVATSDAAVGSRRFAFQYFNVPSNQSVAPVIDPSTDQRINSYLIWFKEVNNPNVTAVATQPATPSEALTVTGTALDVANTGVRLRDTADTGNYETLTLSGITSTSLTATMPAMLTEVPFTVGTSRTCEAIATLSGSPSGTAVAVTVGPESGWAVVELVSPNTTASESLAGNLPFTPIDIDQIYYNTSSGNISVDATGVVTAGPSYVAGTTFQFYGWDESAGSGRWVGPFEAQLTDTGEVVTGAGLSASLLRRRRRM